MGSVGIETAQNVVVDHEVAGVGARILAYLIDMALIIAWIVVWMVLSFGVLDLGGSGGDTVFIVLLCIAFLPLLFYFLLSHILMDGQTLGKRAQKIRVVRMDGLEPSVGQYILRWLLRPIDGFYYIGLIVILVNGKGQRIGDLVAGTTVITLRPRVRLNETLQVTPEPAHAVRFPGALRLSDAQARLVKEVLEKTGPEGEVILRETAAKVRQVIGDAGAGMEDRAFLLAVLRDHVHLTAQQGGSSAPR